MNVGQDSHPSSLAWPKAAIARHLDAGVTLIAISVPAWRIDEGGGAFVSEYAIGDPTFPSCSKHRDRIQAGMSIAVVPVQTPGDVGTMHTVPPERNASDVP